MICCLVTRTALAEMALCNIWILEVDSPGGNGNDGLVYIEWDWASGLRVWRITKWNNTWNITDLLPIHSLLNLTYLIMKIFWCNKNITNYLSLVRLGGRCEIILSITNIFYKHLYSKGCFTFFTLKYSRENYKIKHNLHELFKYQNFPNSFEWKWNGMKSHKLAFSKSMGNTLKPELCRYSSGNSVFNWI